MAQDAVMTDLGSGTKLKGSHAELVDNRLVIRAEPRRALKHSNYHQGLLVGALLGFIFGSYAIPIFTVHFLLPFGLAITIIVAYRLWKSYRGDWVIELADDHLRVVPGAKEAPFVLPRGAIGAVKVGLAQDESLRMCAVLQLDTRDGVQSVVLHESTNSLETKAVAERFATYLGVPIQHRAD